MDSPKKPASSKPKRPAKRRLTLKQERFAQAYVETGNAAAAVRHAYPVIRHPATQRSVGRENRTKPHIAERIKTLLGGKRFVGRAIKALDEGLSGDWPQRQWATDRVLKVAGVYETKQRAGKTINNTQVNVFEALKPEQLDLAMQMAQRIGRWPTDQELAKLTPLPVVVEPDK